MRAAVLGRPVSHSLSPLLAPGRVRGARPGRLDVRRPRRRRRGPARPAGRPRRGVARVLGDHAVQAGGGGRGRPRRTVAAAAPCLEHPGPHRRGLAGREHRRPWHRDGPAGGRRRGGLARAILGAGGPQRRSRCRRSARTHRRRPRPRPGPAEDVVRVLGCAGVDDGDAPRRRRPRRDAWSQVPIDGQDALAAAPVVEPTRRCSTSSTRPWPTPLAPAGRPTRPAGDRRPRRAVPAGHGAGRADDRTARADRCDARGPRRRRLPRADRPRGGAHAGAARRPAAARRGDRSVARRPSPPG